MKIVSMGGGLGNQMFKYAFALALKKVHPDEEIMIDSRMCRYRNDHNGYELEHLFDLKLKEASWREVRSVSKRASLSILYKLNPQWYDRSVKRFYDCKDENYVEDYQAAGVYNDGLLYSTKSLYYDVAAQAWQYYDGMEEELNDTFRLKKKNCDDAFLEKEYELGKECSIGIHIRGGDYLSKVNKIYNVCTIEYYKEALRILKQRCPEGRLYVFTNDVPYLDSIRESVFGNERITVMGHQGKDSYKDIFLMKKCQALIIANSSFSWWGAWLNNRKDKIVIAPKQWMSGKGFPDVCPNFWLRL